MDNATYPITDYSIHFMPKGIVHSLQDCARYYRFLFNEDYFETCPIKKNFIESLPFFKQRSSGLVLTFELNTFNKIKNLISEIIKEYAERHKEKRRCEIIQTLIHLFLLECDKKATEKGSIQTQIIQNTIPEIMEKLLHAIELHYKKRWKVQQYAAYLYISTSQLNRYCQTVFQKSVQDLVQERTLKESKNLLLHTQSAINEIAWELGFEHPANFTNFFITKMGISPSQFRKKNA